MSSILWVSALLFVMPVTIPLFKVMGSSRRKGREANMDKEVLGRVKTVVSGIFTILGNLGASLVAWCITSPGKNIQFRACLTYAGVTALRHTQPSRVASM